MKINFIIIGICATVLGGSMLYIKWLQAENETLRANQAKLEQSIADQTDRDWETVAHIPIIMKFIFMSLV